jgi:hypothetical protein
MQVDMRNHEEEDESMMVDMNLDGSSRLMRSISSSSSKKQIPITQIASLPVPMPTCSGQDGHASGGHEVVSMTPDELKRKAKEQMEKLAQIRGTNASSSSGNEIITTDLSSIACSSSCSTSSSTTTFSSNTTLSSTSLPHSSVPTSSSLTSSSASSSSKIKIEWKKKK